MTTTEDERFWKRVDRTGDCWVWTGSLTNTGYGRFRKRQPRSIELSHRYAWRTSQNETEIPSGMYVCHRCDNPPCVRPDHLFLGSPTDNMQDARSKGKKLGPRSRLKPEERLAIRESPESNTVLARRYGLSNSYVSTLRSGKSYRRPRHEAMKS